MKRLSSLLLALALTTTSFCAEPSAKEIHTRSLGKWSKEVDYQGATYRLVKDIGKEQETVSVYDVNEELVHQRVVEIKIEMKSGLAIFTYSNGKITAGENKGEKWGGDEPSSYVFKIHDDKWYEAHEMFIQSESEPSWDVYDRVK